MQQKLSVVGSRLFRRVRGENEMRLLLGEALQTESALFFHCPSGSLEDGMAQGIRKLFFEYAEKLLRRDGSFSAPPDTRFITYNNSRQPSLIERFYTARRIGPVSVVAKEYQSWDWIAKVKPVLETLEQAKEEYVVATDGNDVALANDPSRLLTLFAQYECDLLFCNTNADWPPNDRCSLFESKKNWQYPFHAHLSAGGYVGRRLFVVQCLREILDAYAERSDWVFFHGRFDDQLGWRHLHTRYYPRIKIDSRCQVFKRFDVFLRRA